MIKKSVVNRPVSRRGIIRKIGKQWKRQCWENRTFHIPSRRGGGVSKHSADASRSKCPIVTFAYKTSEQSYGQQGKKAILTSKRQTLRNSRGGLCHFFM